MKFFQFTLQISKEKANVVDELVSPITPDFIPKDPPRSDCKPKLCKRRKQNAKPLSANVPWGLQGTDSSTSFCFRKQDAESRYVHLSNLASTDARHKPIHVLSRAKGSCESAASYSSQNRIPHGQVASRNRTEYETQRKCN